MAAPITGLEWSPGGDTLAVLTSPVQPTDGRPLQGASLTVIRLDDGSQTALFIEPDGFDLSSPRWSSDGDRIAFVRAGVAPDGVARFDIMTMAADGSDPQPSLSDPISATATTKVSNLVWSPDGRYLTFSVGGVDNAVWVVSADGQDQTIIPGVAGTYALTDMAAAPAWQPIPAGG
jgi:Tol biopolymer transport system component